MRPIASPHHALRSRLGVGLSESRRIGVAGRSQLCIEIGARQLHPGAALVDQAADDGEARVLGPQLRPHAAHVIEHDRRGQAIPQRLGGDDLVAQHVDLHMPAEHRYAPRQGLNHVERGHRRHGIGLGETDAADARVVQGSQLRVRDVGANDRNAARIGPDLRNGIERHPIVGDIGRRRHDDIARGSDAPLQQPVLRDARIGLHARLRIARRKTHTVIDVVMAIAGIEGRFETRFFGAGRIRHLRLAIGLRDRRGRPCDDEAANNFPPVDVLDVHHHAAFAKP